MQKNSNVVTIPKEDAVFWLDAQGRWQNEHGPFEHPKVSAYFHRCIQKDEQGFFVGQQRDDIYEKVYFRYEDTALFVFGVEIEARSITLRLNNGQRIQLEPTELSIKDDQLYIQTPAGPARFNQQSLLKMADLIEEADEGLCIKVGGRQYRISGHL